MTKTNSIRSHKRGNVTDEVLVRSLLNNCEGNKKLACEFGDIEVLR